MVAIFFASFIDCKPYTPPLHMPGEPALVLDCLIILNDFMSIVGASDTAGSVRAYNQATP